MEDDLGGVKFKKKKIKKIFHRNVQNMTLNE